MDPFYDDLYDDFYASSDFASSGSDYTSYLEDQFEFESEQSEGHTLSYLNERDYSLNSPIISDELNEFLKFCRNQSYRDGWRKKDWEKSRSWVSMHAKVFDLNSSSFHEFVGNLMLYQNINSTLPSIISNVNKGYQESKWVLESFFSDFHLPPETFDLPSKDLPSYCIKMFKIFWTFHWIIQLMNSKSDAESNHLISTINRENEFKAFNEKQLIHFKQSPIGEIYFDHNFVLIPRHQQLISHCHSLMIKDMNIARFNSLLYIHSRKDPLFKNVNIDKAIKFYQLGDECMIKRKNDVYDLLSLIEPTCNERFVQTAHECRPLIPLNNNFSSFVKSKQEEQINHSEVAREFFSILNSLNDLGEILHYYGVFRHWGHPEIDYLAGLKKLHDQVQLPKVIDEDYANALASDLAFLILKKEFKKNHKWHVDKKKLTFDHPLYNHIADGTFPNDAEILNFGDHWHELPLTPCFDIPEVIDPSQIYSDKSHSLQLSEVKNFIRKGIAGKIPSKRVLTSYLERPATNWLEFLDRVNSEGLGKESLVIGLKAKEREIKKVGRFFALMSWELREYFVVTEFLIKKHFVPLFQGLTMADDFSTVTKKMLDRCSGQGLNDYSRVCYANHIDYEKWNNHQRMESTGPVFEVMGKFLGYPNLIKRTHEFFQESFVYYNNRPDLMTLRGDEIINSTENTVCWNGQKGGLEGLRQKGWSIVNLLVIRREARMRNTKVSVLAQGDNQVVCTQFAVQKTKTQMDLIQNLSDIYEKNEIIMSMIRTGTNKLGLLINESETIQGSDYLNYGKVPIWRGNICPLPTKRWSRVCCVTNDQLPSMANLMATVSTNALTVSNFSLTPIPSVIFMTYFGNLVFEIVKRHNPAIRCPMIIPDDSIKAFRIGFLFLDPSLGGISGTNLNRFIVRGFPDPVTESLSFWKFVERNTKTQDESIMCGQMAAVELHSYDPKHLTKLIENPVSLNLKQGLSPDSIIKEHVKKALLNSLGNIGNQVIHKVLENYEFEQLRLLDFLNSIHPRFPRFLSEFKAASFIGIMDNLIGLFQNSKTIRSNFKKKYLKDINSLIVKAEESGISTLNKIVKRLSIPLRDVCSSQLADNFRTASWGEEIVGATIPHPVELFSNFSQAAPNCYLCLSPNDEGFLCTRSVLPNINQFYQQSGPYPPYLGSATLESTSILSPWEQESKIPIITRAKNLRRSIGWFIDPNTKLSQSILKNLQSLTGLEWKDLQKEFKRTGSALHRFGSERQSCGGFNAVSPTGLSRTYTTTDFLKGLQQDNFDFMFQSAILFSQFSVILIGQHNVEAIYHHHTQCKRCIRPIKEITLDSSIVYTDDDKSYLLNQWKPTSSNWIVDKPSVNLKIKNWNEMNSNEQSFAIGRVQGFIFGLIKMRGLTDFDKKKLFPQVLKSKLNPKWSLYGILDGLLRSACLHILQRQLLYKSAQPHKVLVGAFLDNIEDFSIDESVLSYITHVNWQNELSRIPHKTPASFPQSKMDSTYLLVNYLRYFGLRKLRSNPKQYIKSIPILIFSDLNTSDIILPFGLTNHLIKVLLQHHLSSKNLAILRELSDTLTRVYSDDLLPGEEEMLTKSIYCINHEVRHSVKNLEVSEQLNLEYGNEIRLTWTEEYTGLVYKIPILFGNQTSYDDYPKLKFSNQHVSPLLSGLRIFQFATGSHYKLRCILKDLKLTVRDFACLGDGSGGLTALCLRYYPNSLCLFNSLIKLDNTPIYGQEPGPPSAIMALGVESSRCVNLNEVCRVPSDLTHIDSWRYLISKTEDHQLSIDLLVVDCETTDDVRIKIEENLIQYSGLLLTEKGTLIYKTYLTLLIQTDFLQKMGALYHDLTVYQTSMTTCFSEEVYVVCQGKNLHIIDRIPDKLNLLELSKEKFVCFNDPIVEFERCVNLLNQDLWKGVPPELMLDPNLAISELLRYLGVPSGIAYSVTETYGPTWDINSIIALMSTTIHHIFISSSRSQSHLRPPSDNLCINVLIAIFGFGYYLSWITQDFKRFNYLNHQLVRKTPFFWSDPILITKDRYQIPWSLSRKSNNVKAFYIDKEKGSVANLIRALSNLKFLNVPFNVSHLNFLINKYDRHLTFQFLKIHSGMYDLLQMKSIPIDVKLTSQPKKFTDITSLNE